MAAIVKCLPSTPMIFSGHLSGENKFIFTRDNTSLYVFISNDEGTQALKYFLNHKALLKNPAQKFKHALLP